MVDNYFLQGQIDKARSLFEHLLSLRNDVGLLAEEYDAKEHRQLGNFPQAFSHLALVNSAHNLSSGVDTRPAHDRSQAQLQPMPV
jgi:GH15 family glucan-1,4-alpha-glucosidase